MNPILPIALQPIMLVKLLPKSDISARENLKWLFILRNLLLIAESLLILMSEYVLRISLPLDGLWLAITAIGAVNAFTWLRLNSDVPVTELEIFVHLSLDVIGITLLLYLTGGATNPIIWIFLLPLILTAIILPHDYTWYMVILTTSMYTFLIGFHIPLPAIEPSFDPHEVAHKVPLQTDMYYFNLHMFGMWFGFVFSAGLVAYFVVELSRTLKERERKLAEAREMALRDERAIALGTLAASAAHDMGTPLGTIAILAHELRMDYPEHRLPELHQKLQIIEDQIGRCKKALSVMSSSAGRLRAESGQIMPLVDYLDEVISQWRAQQPGVKLNLCIAAEEAPPAQILADHSLTHALINILNNAGQASPPEKGVDFVASWDEQQVVIKIRDYGRGIAPEIAKIVGKTPVSTKQQGLGVGLFLTFTTIKRLGGKIKIFNKEDGGACVDLTLPLLPINNESHHE